MDILLSSEQGGEEEGESDQQQNKNWKIIKIK